ncbi:MAG TPA: DUF1003 domain-containing protein [Ktedonobacterales bacterium]|nr:DUF1003 domain-containing protein [Ktedonobacterales bacterium]
MSQETASTSVSAETTSQPQPQGHHLHLTSHLFHHEPRQHQPRNINEVQAAERLSFNDRVAVWVAANVGTMICAYIFAIIGITSIVGYLTNSTTLALISGSLSSYFLQLVLLPIIMVGQNVQSRHSELQADEAFKTTMSTYHDIEQIMQHLAAQDSELLRHAKMLEDLLEKNGISFKQREAEGTATSHLTDPFAQPQAGSAAPAAATPTDDQKQKA